MAARSVEPVSNVTTGRYCPAQHTEAVGRGGAVDLQPVRARPAVEAVAAVAGVRHEAVIAAAQLHPVGAGVAVHAVGTAAAEQRLDAGSLPPA